MKKKPLQIGFIAAGFGLITFGAFFFAENISTEGAVAQTIQSLGIFGIIFLALISGLNPFLPVPSATFAPLFLEAGFSIYAIIAGFVIGTTIADTIGYTVGWLGSSYANTKFPKLTERIQDFLNEHERFALPATFAYFAFAPLPNELILIPLALSNVSYKKLIIPIIIGNTIHHTILVFGYKELFGLFF